MKMIFLDIDGPMANTTWLDGKVKITETTVIPYAWEQEQCDSLKRILKATGAVVVISSDWKQYYTLEQIRSMFRYYGLPGRSVVGVTINDKPKLSANHQFTRAHQIKEWVKSRKPEAWVAIDDMNLGHEFERYGKEMKWMSGDNHVQTVGDWADFSKENLTLSQLESKIIEKLNGRDQSTDATDDSSKAGS